jgi:hypothetical protein
VVPFGMEISPSTKTLNFLIVQKEGISSMKLVKNPNFDNLYNVYYTRMTCSVKDFLNIQEHSSCQHIFVEIQGYMIHQPHILKCCTVICSKTALTCI